MVDVPLREVVVVVVDVPLRVPLRDVTWVAVVDVPFRNVTWVVVVVVDVPLRDVA